MNTTIKTALFVGLFLILFGTMKSNAEAIIKAFEGKKLKAYKDSVGIWTIGFGSIYHYDLKRPIQRGDVITEEKAIEWLQKEIKDKTRSIKQFITVPINKNQLDALISLVYNIGLSAFKKSTLLKLLNQNADKISVADQFLRWNKGRINGKLVTIPGLTNRRKLERELFLK
jgi:lysozyme